MARTVGELGEFGLIGAVTARLAPGDATLLGPGDDAAVVAAPDGRVVATTDLLMEGRHFRRDWSGPYDIGAKAAAANLADIAAMGARPTALLAGVAAPADLPVADALALIDGLQDEAAGAGAAVVGGDMVNAEIVVVAVTALGTLDSAAPVRRDGARPGDVLAVRGRLGWSAAGLAVLTLASSGRRAATAAARCVSTPAGAAVIGAHRRPRPPYAAGMQAARHGATSMCDVSDGLLQDLGHLASASGVGIEVDVASLVVDDPVVEVARALSVDPVTWALTGGEDHALAATFPADPGPPEGWRPIGRVVVGSGVQAPGYDRALPGWDHFRARVPGEGAG